MFVRARALVACARLDDLRPVAFSLLRPRAGSFQKKRCRRGRFLAKSQSDVALGVRRRHAPEIVFFTSKPRPALVPVLPPLLVLHEVPLHELLLHLLLQLVHLLLRELLLLLMLVLLELVQHPLLLRLPSRSGWSDP